MASNEMNEQEFRKHVHEEAEKIKQEIINLAHKVNTLVDLIQQNATAIQAVSFRIDNIPQRLS